MNEPRPDILISRASGRIHIALRAVFMGRDLCLLITGGDTPHLGAVTAVSKTSPASTTVFGTHKEYHVTELFAARLREEYDGNAVVCCGIHLDNISKAEIDTVMALAADMLDELCLRLKETDA